MTILPRIISSQGSVVLMDDFDKIGDNQLAPVKKLSFHVARRRMTLTFQKLRVSVIWPFQKRGYDGLIISVSGISL